MRNLKRKAEELEQMELASTATSVRKRPEERERERNSMEQFEFVERKLTGEAIHGNIELIWDRLTKNRGCKLGIYGMGGVGKTTIMMRIHNRLLRDATFDGVDFITVSKDFNIHKLQSDIGKALQRLERKKNCVLILDDVWELLDLKEVGIPVRAKGFKLVLTTRSYDVCCGMRCQEKIKIQPLSQEEAESLFLEELGSKVPPDLEIVKSIVTECAGLPIGVITMARSMRGATHVFEWRDALERLKESSMGLKDMEEKVLMILKFSFDRLGCPDIQQCFLSCALYPEDARIDKSELIEFFIDQGLIDGIDGLDTREEQYNRGLDILEKLRNVSLLEDQWSWMKMHDLIRDMALHIMGATSMVKARKQLMRIPSEECWTDTLEKVSLMKNNIREFSQNFSPSCPKLSTLLLNRCLSCDGAIPDSFFKNLLGLKVLNLSGNDMTELPNSISDLVNLRALLLKGCCELRHIPYLGKLTSLRKLDAECCCKLEAVEGLEKLVNLRYLDLHNSCIERLPKGTLDCLVKLQYLKVEAVNEEDITKLGALETFICNPRDAKNFNRGVRVIKQSDNPRHYTVVCDLEEVQFLVEVCNDARSGNSGRRVNIVGCDDAIVSVGRECTGEFILIPQDVQTMAMKCCNGITNLSGMGPLKYLEELDIDECENLGVLCGGQGKEVIEIHYSPAPAPAPAPTAPLFRNLRVLKIYKCPKLKYVFGHGSKSNLQHLRKIKIFKCEEMVGIIAAVTSAPPHLLPCFPSLEKISVNHCNKMKRVVESKWMPHFPNLRRIKVSECEKMEEMIGGPLTHEWLLYLQNLQSIKIRGCKGMVEMISGAGQGQEGSIMTLVNNTPSSFQSSSFSLPMLERLELWCLPQLKSICEVPISCDFLKDLFVYNCPELKGIPLQLQVHDIEDLLDIMVEDEEEWKMLTWDDPDAQAILRPYLRKGEHARLVPSNAIEMDAKGKDLL